MIARAHQLVMEGYKTMFDEQCVTVWSAPNYCYRCGNVGSIMEIDDHLQKRFQIVNAAPSEVCGPEVFSPFFLWLPPYMGQELLSSVQWYIALKCIVYIQSCV